MSDDLSFFFPELDPANDGIVPLPPAEMRFLELKTEPVIDDGPLRLRVYVETTAFQQRPYLEVVLTDAEGSEIASASVIEPMSRKNVFTLHMRAAKAGKFSLHARLYYPDGPQNKPVTCVFAVEPPTPQPDSN